MAVLTPSTSNEHGLEVLVYVPFFPFAHFWFIQALFVVFLVLVALEVMGCLKTLPRALAVLTSASFLYCIETPLPAFFCLSQADYLLPFFLAGLILVRFASERHIRDLSDAGSAGGWFVGRNGLSHAGSTTLHCRVVFRRSVGDPSYAPYTKSRASCDSRKLLINKLSLSRFRHSRSSHQH